VSLHFTILEREKVIFIHTVIIPNFGGIIKMFGPIAYFPKNFREKKGIQILCGHYPEMLYYNYGLYCSKKLKYQNT
jgi:hypothetical protein